MFVVVVTSFLLRFTGSTPLGCYQKLIEYYKNGDLSFQYVKTFNMDEYVGECLSCSSSQGLSLGEEWLIGACPAINWCLCYSSAKG